MTAPEERARAVFGERAAFYTTSKCHTDPQVLGRVVELAQPQAQWQVLDIGTGTGHTAFALAPHVQRVVATDLTPEMLAEAEKLQEENGLENVVFREADVHDLPFADASFDLVTCRRAAHHFSAIDSAVAEMVRVLKPGGRILIDDRSVPEDDFVDRTMNELDLYHDRSHVRQYRPSQWQGMLEAAGIRVDAVEPYTKHRPLTSLTDGVDAEDVERIHAIVQGWDAEQCRKMHYEARDGIAYTDHWYVLVAGTKGYNDGTTR